MRKISILAFVLLLAVAGMAQQRTGNIVVTLDRRSGLTSIVSQYDREGEASDGP